MRSFDLCGISTTRTCISRNKTIRRPGRCEAHIRVPNRPSKYYVCVQTGVPLYNFVGAVKAFGNASVDPIFSTGPAHHPSSHHSPLSPIICDTKYYFCADGENDCSPLLGESSIISLLCWPQNQETFGKSLVSTWFLLQNGALVTLSCYFTSLGSSAIVASQTVDARLQLELESCNYAPRTSESSTHSSRRSCFSVTITTLSPRVLELRSRI